MRKLSAEMHARTFELQNCASMIHSRNRTPVKKQIVEELGQIDKLIKNTRERIAGSKQLAVQSRELIELAREYAQRSPLDPQCEEIANKLTALCLRLDRRVI
jgi:hypothetical protein